MDGTTRVGRGLGQLLEILEAAFEFESWRFFLLALARFVVVFAHSSA